MLRLPAFRYLAPTSVDDAAAYLAEAPRETMILAGGTDLVPNMKRRQQTPRAIVGLRQIPSLAQVTHHDAGVRIGATATLASLGRDARLHASLPGLWQAIVQVATPHLRTMGTIGGNLCLDTRCTYYDQTEEWRRAIGYCMKKEGTTCWVATSSPRCLAVSSTDTAPMLQALDARVELVSAAGTRTVAVADLYANDGMAYLTRRPDEILTAIEIPYATGLAAPKPLGEGGRSTYWKVRRRGSFDFPVASVAAAVDIDGDGRVRDVRIVLGAVLSRPASAPRAEALLRGERLDDDRIAAAADAAYDVAKPMDNTDFELHWRKKVVRSLVGHALRELRGDDVREARLRLARQVL
jgi:4-hydroxybenzoyl-CoA reductase subunit beta